MEDSADVEVNAEHPSLRGHMHACILVFEPCTDENGLKVD